MAAPFALVGCDYRGAGAARRSQLVLDEAGRRALLAGLGSDARGLVALDTCGRTEWLAESSSPTEAAGAMEEELRRRWTSLPAAGGPRHFVLLGVDAARHSLRVAVGLESFIPGEREIAGQWQAALARSRAEGACSPALHALGAAAGRLVRRVERQTRFREPGRSVARLVADLLRARGLGAGSRVGVVGAGEIGSRIATVLDERGHAVAAFTRTPRPDGRWLPLSEVPARAAELDALVVATASPAPIVAAADLVAAPAMLVIDLGIPQQVEGVPPGAFLLDLDAVVASAREGRGPVATDEPRVEGLVDIALDELAGDLARRAASTEASQWPSIALPSR